MKFGVREICDVVLRAKKNMTIGNYKFNKDMPVFYFDSLKTSTLESAATTVYAQGGQGNSRLIAWEGEKTVTFTMEDALISTLSLSILSGAGVLEKSANSKDSYTHATETVEVLDEAGTITITYEIFNDVNKDFNTYVIPLDENGDISGQPATATVKLVTEIDGTPKKSDDDKYLATLEIKGQTLKAGSIYLLDYYYITSMALTQIDVTPDKFAGHYYLEASTLFRNKDGVDLPAEFIIPNCKIQSNFTFTMASSGDPSTFTFTMDAFPDYTKYNKTTKVLAAIQILSEGKAEDTEKINNDTATITYTAESPASSYSRRKSTVSEEI